MKRIIFDKSSFLLTLIFIVATALIFFLMGLTYKHLEKLSENSSKFTHTYEVSLRLQKLYSDLKDIETERRNFILVRDAESEKIIKDRFLEIDALQKEIYSMVSENPEQIENMDLLNDMVDYKQRIISQTFSEYRGSLAEPDNMKLYLLAGKNVMSSIQEKVEEMMQIEKQLLEKRKNDYLFSQKSTPFYLYIISIFSLGLLGFAYYKIDSDVKHHKQVNRELKISLNSSNLAEQVGNYGIWLMNKTKKEFVFSDNEYRLLGYEPQSVVPHFDFFSKHAHPEDLKMVNEKTNELLEGKSPTFVFRAIRKDGELRHFQTTAKTVEMVSGEKVVLGITNDVTHDIENQLKLESVNWSLTEQNKNLSITNETYTEAEKIGIFGTWQWFIHEDRFNFSDNLFRIFGFEPNEVEPELKSFFTTIHPDDLKLVQEKVAKMYKKEFVAPFYHRIFKNDTQELRYVSITSKIIHDQEVGDYFLVITEDITEEMKSQHDILEKNRILEATNKELQAFNYVASHDLQEPLRKIETFISRLHEKDFENLSDSGKKYVERMQNSARRMRTLINDLLQFSRTTKTEQVFEKINLNDILTNVKESLSQQIHEKSAKIYSEKLPTLKVIPFQIHQLFENLISNSLKYSKESVSPEIHITVKKINSENESRLPNNLAKAFYQFDFKDNGIGFEQDYAEKIFLLFNRLHGKTEYAGTGIGLAICKKIVENHQGYIFAEAEANEGANFTIFLPVIV